MKDRMSDIIEQRKCREEMLDSYLEAIREVGGCTKGALANLDKITVAQMMDGLAPNHIRFTVDREALAKAREELDSQMDGYENW